MKKYTRLYLLIWCLICINVSVFAQSTIVAFSCNAFEVGYQYGNKSLINKEYARLPANHDKPIRIYFKLLGKGKVDIQLIASAPSGTTCDVLFQGKSKTIKWEKGAPQVDIGNFTIVEPGYYFVEFKNASAVIHLLSIKLSGSATDAGVISSQKRTMDYWTRRGPSCHLAYHIPTSLLVQYYYSELIVPKGADPVGSYFMANGFGEGYFGIQVNSPTERRILFSVWGSDHENDPNKIPEDEKIVLIRKGQGVQVGEFGNEGAGGQSYLKYPWKAGTKYKFLLKGEPVGNNTQYTAWFYATEEDKWKLIASFKKPKISTHLTSFYSFVENFYPDYGYLNRRAQFLNQWVYDGSWKPVASAIFTVDETYNAKQRIDANGGHTSNGYFLEMGGFFNAELAPNTKIKNSNSNKKPNIDFNKLP